LRLISNVSLVDEVIDRLLFENQNEIEIENWYTCPSKPGIGFTDEQICSVHTEVMDALSRGPVAEGDVSSWDWTVAEWELMAEAEMRIKLMDAEPSSPIARVIRNRIMCVASSVFVLSNGVMLAQESPGIMLSGWYCTSSSNSRIGCLLARMAGADWSIHMGDDFLTRWKPELVDTFNSLGHKLKLYKEINENCYEFCSTLYPSGEPVNVWKTLVRLLSHSNTLGFPARLALFDQWRYEMRHCPLRHQLEELIVLSGFLDGGGLAIANHAQKENSVSW